jgi:hypothetical protein
MRVTSICQLSLPFGLVAVLMLFQCDRAAHRVVADSPSVLDEIPTGTPNEVVGPMMGCDPDGVQPCPEGWFICYTVDANAKICISREPVTPDQGGGWACRTEGDDFVCDGGGEATTGSGWDCETDVDGDETCRRDGESYHPSLEIDGTWNCYYDNEYVVCDTGSGGSQGGDGNGDGDGDGNGDGDGDGTGTDGGSDTNVPCVCAPGAMRYCDTLTYCSWGVQYCDDDGMGWSDCVEEDPAEGCSGDTMDHGGYYFSRSAQHCCVRMGHCCQDFWDTDGDGDNQESVGNCVEPEPVCG